MSQENLIRIAYEAWGEEDLDRLLETCDPEIEFRTSGAFPDFEPIYRGHDGIRNFWEAMRVPWEWFHLDVGRVVEGQGCAAAVIHFSACGRESGVRTDLVQGHAMRFRNDLIAKISAHRSFDEAVEAAGLSE